MLAQILSGQLFHLFLVFCRIGSAMMLMPALGEQTVPARMRLLLGLAICVVVQPLVDASLPELPVGPVPLLLMLGGEIGVGIFIGSIGRLMYGGLSFAGTVIAFQTGLSSAQVLNPAIAEEESLPGVLFGLLGLVIIFETDLYQMLVRGLVDSYALFVPGNLPPMGDFTETITRVVGRSFSVGMQLSAPFIIVSSVLLVAMGLLARVMPSLQIFFLMTPIQLYLGLGLIAVCLPAMMLYFFSEFSALLNSVLAP